MLIMPKFVEKNRLNMPSTRIRQEQEIVAQMVRIYCRQKEKHTDLCPDCKELLQYAHARLSHCPFGEKKTTCRLCPVHCSNQIGARKCRRSCVLLAPEWYYIIRQLLSGICYKNFFINRNPLLLKIHATENKLVCN